MTFDQEFPTDRSRASSVPSFVEFSEISDAFSQSMERFGGSLPVKGYSGEMAGKKRVQLPADLGKGMFIVYILTSWIVLNVRAMLKRNFYFKSKTFFESLSVEWNYYWKLTRWCKLSRQGSLFLNLLNLKICVLRLNHNNSMLNN